MCRCTAAASGTALQILKAPVECISDSISWTRVVTPRAAHSIHAVPEIGSLPKACAHLGQMTTLRCGLGGPGARRPWVEVIGFKEKYFLQALPPLRCLLISGGVFDVCVFCICFRRGSPTFTIDTIAQHAGFFPGTARRKDGAQPKVQGAMTTT